MNNTEEGKSRVSTDPFTRKGKGASQKGSKAFLRSEGNVNYSRVLSDKDIQHVIIVLEHLGLKLWDQVILPLAKSDNLPRVTKRKERSSDSSASRIHQVLYDQGICSDKGGSSSL